MNLAAVSVLLSVHLVYAFNNVFIQRYSVAEHTSIQVKQDFEAIIKSITPLSSPVVCRSDFLSFGLDSSLIREKYKGFDFGSLKLINLAAELGPTNLRIGGTSADFLTFDPNGSIFDTVSPATKKQMPVSNDLSMIDSGAFKLKNDSNFTMTGDQWKSITTFAAKVKWHIMFDFNLFKWKHWPDGPWDPRNAEVLLSYSSDHGINISAFQLGNEPNSFYHNFNLSVPPSSLVTDLAVLRHSLDSFPAYRGKPIYGPDVTSVGRHKGAYKYMKEFLSVGGYQVVNAACWHHYYINGRTATVDQFLDSKVLDSFKEDLMDMKDLVRDHNLPLRLTETSSCFGGGAPGLSDRYIAGFMWLDKLGLSALANVSAVFRQTFFHGNYALISPSLDPNPDYWLSVIFKRLVLGPVLNISPALKDPNLRVYANCARRDVYNYPAGSLVVYYLNVGISDLYLTLGYEGLTHDLFMLTPGDNDGMTSRFVKLNGKVISMSGSVLPELAPLSLKGRIKVTARSFGFIVIPQAQMLVCQ